MSNLSEMSSETAPFMGGLHQILAHFQKNEDMKRARLFQIHHLMTELRDTFNGGPEISTGREEELKIWIGTLCRDIRQYRLAETQRRKIAKTLLSEGREREATMLAAAQRFCLLPSVESEHMTNAPTKASDILPPTSGAAHPAMVIRRCQVCELCIAANRAAGVST